MRTHKLARIAALALSTLALTAWAQHKAEGVTPAEVRRRIGL